MRVPSLPLALALALAACGPEPYYDSNIGVSGVTTAEGALAGSFAVHQRNIYVGYFPVLGREVESGGDQYFLATRSWNAAAQRYDEQWRFCRDESMESAGLTMVTPDATRDTVVLQDSALTIDHASGAFARPRMGQLWALRDLPDVDTTPVPTPSDYQQSPQRDYIYDADSDGHVGCTMLLSGLVEGEDYYINRKLTAFTGVVVSADHSFGLVTIQSTWSVLESTVAMAVQTGSVPSDEYTMAKDPKRSWFEEVRLSDSATCSDVIAAIDSEALAKTRPF